MPLSKEYFQENISNFDGDEFIIYRPDATTEDMISIMWNAAKGSVWSDIFDVKDIDNIYNKIKSWYPANYSIRGNNWYFDQKTLKKYIEEYEKKDYSKIVRLNDESAGFCRLNRSNYSIFFNKFYDFIRFSHAAFAVFTASHFTVIWADKFDAIIFQCLNISLCRIIQPHSHIHCRCNQYWLVCSHENSRCKIISYPRKPFLKSYLQSLEQLKYI